MQKMMMMLNNMNMQIRVYEINRESLITKINGLLYLFDNSNLESRYVHVATELCMGHKPPTYLGTTNTLEKSQHNK